MEQIITLKVDLEYPDEAHHAIDEAAKAYEADKLKWTEEEILEAQNLAMRIMSRLCLDGYSIEWFGSKNYLSLFIREYQQDELDKKVCSDSLSKFQYLDCQVRLSVPCYRQESARVHHQKGW